MKLLPDGAVVCVNRKLITAMWLDHLYIEEADRSAGIKVVYGNYCPPGDLQRGNLVSLCGEMGTMYGQRVIHARSLLECPGFDAVGRIDPLGMSSPAIVGWPSPAELPDAPRIQGLMPLGLYIRIWGRVTATNWSDEDGYFFYLDDGWAKKDGTDIGAPGIRVYGNTAPPLNQYLIATGMLAYRTYDPTPFGPSGDEFSFPVVRCGDDQDFYSLAADRGLASSGSLGSVSGRVRLIGESAPGKTVRVYAQGASVLLENVTDEYVPFTLGAMPASSEPVTASVAGYISFTRIAKSGDTGLDFELELSSVSIEVSSDRSAIRACSDEVATVTAFARDCEGKALAGRQVRLTTNRGQFVETGTNDLILTADESGFVDAHLNAGTDGPGTAIVTVCDSPAGEPTSLSVEFVGRTVVLAATPYYLTQSGTSAITAQVMNGDTPIPQASITFRTDHGVFQQSGTTTYSAQADGFGIARATLSVSSSGTAKVSATYVNACSQSVVSWVCVAYKTTPLYAMGGTESNPLVADLDGDPNGRREIVVVTSEAKLVVLNSACTELWSKGMHLPWECTPSCAMLDSGPNARPCVFVPDEGQQRVLGYAYNGEALAGWPVGSGFPFLGVAAAIADVNLDGSLEIVCGDQSCYVLCWNPTGDWRKSGTSFLWKNLTGTPSTTIRGSSCAVGDLDNADTLDVVCGGIHPTALYGFPGWLWGDFGSWPEYLDGYPKPTGDVIESSPAIGDIDGDGKNDVAVGSGDENVYIGLSSDGSWRGYPTGGSVKSSPALADLDGDGRLDVIVGSASGRVFALNWLGQPLLGWANGIRLNTTGTYPISSSPVVGDVTGDGQVEVVIGCDDGNIYVLYRDGIEHQIAGQPTGPVALIRCCIPPTKTAAQIRSAAAIDDLNNDGKIDIVAVSTEGIYVFPLNANYVQSALLYPWPTFHHDNQRTGCSAAAPPAIFASIQGRVTKDGEPVPNAQVYIKYNDDSGVPEPNSDPAVDRSYVLTVGTTNPNEIRRGAYCISQLPPNSTYKIRVEATGEPSKIIPDIAVTTGLLIVDVAL